MLTYVAKLLIVPVLFAVAVVALATLLGCRALIGVCMRREAGEEPA